MGLSSQERALIHAALVYVAVLFIYATLCHCFFISPRFLALVLVFPRHSALRVHSMSLRHHRYATIWWCYCYQWHLTIWRIAWQNSSATLESLPKEA